jgi:eukaryotic translation initiation factor 2C
VIFIFLSYLSTLVHDCMYQMVTDLAEMMEERLKLFREKNKVLPNRILVYRDGVSEVRLPLR